MKRSRKRGISIYGAMLAMATGLVIVAEGFLLLGFSMHSTLAAVLWIAVSLCLAYFFNLQGI